MKPYGGRKLKKIKKKLKLDEPPIFESEKQFFQFLRCNAGS